MTRIPYDLAPQISEGLPFLQTSPIRENPCKSVSNNSLSPGFDASSEGTADGGCKPARQAPDLSLAEGCLLGGLCLWMQKAVRPPASKQGSADSAVNSLVLIRPGAPGFVVQKTDKLCKTKPISCVFTPKTAIRRKNKAKTKPIKPNLSRRSPDVYPPFLWRVVYRDEDGQTQLL
jgi:hypothetical protein